MDRQLNGGSDELGGFTPVMLLPQPGRPKTPEDVRALVIRLAKENE